MTFGDLTYILPVLGWPPIGGHRSIVEIQGYHLAMLQTGIVIEIIATFCENSPILRKNWPFWPPVTSNLTWSENDLSIFIELAAAYLWNAVYRFSLPFLVFEFSGWWSSAPPPRPCEGGSEPRVTTPNSKGRQLIRFLRHRASLVNYDNGDNGWWPLSWHWIKGLKKIPKCRVGFVVCCEPRRI